MKTGDAVASVAKPVAKTLDRILGTNISSCEKCGKMQSQLNSAEDIWDFYDAVKSRFKHEPKEKTNADTSK